MSKYKTTEELEKLNQACQYVENRAMSLRQASDWLAQQTGKTMSYEGIRQHLKRRRTGYLKGGCLEFYGEQLRESVNALDPTGDNDSVIGEHRESPETLGHTS